MHLKIERRNNAGIVDMIVYNDDLSEAVCAPGHGRVIASQPLPFTDSARDFVFTAWHDANNNGVLDPGEDSRTIEVHVVEGWTDEGDWTTGQAAMVRANTDGASLAQLALAITNNAADAALLGNVGRINKDDLIDVTPLFLILENRMRYGVREAALATKNAEFGQSAGFVAYSANEARIRAVFDPNSTEPRMTTACQGMVMLEMAYGLMKILREGEFDEMELTPARAVSGPSQHDYSPFIRQRDTAITDTRIGDWITFIGKDPPGQLVSISGGEQTVKVDPDSYFGFDSDGGSCYSASVWTQCLVDWYNSGPKVEPHQRITVADIAGYDGYARFFDGAKVGQAIFKFRTKDEKPFP